MPSHALPVNAFADCLRAARDARSLSVRDLEKLAGVSFSLISALENGRRSAGPVTLRKLVTALRLHGEDKKRFLALGGDTSDRHRLKVDTKRKGMHLLRDLIAVLAGVEHDDIEDIIVEYRSPVAKITYDFVVRLRDGSLLAGEIKRDQIRIVPSDPTTGDLPPPATPGRPGVGRVIRIPTPR